jgi:hypothetical protein
VVDDNSILGLRQKPFQLHAFWRRYCQYYMIIYQILQALGEVVESMEKLERDRTPVECP